MTVYELNREQLTELKQAYLTRVLDERGESPSQYELANIDDYVSDEEIFDEYAGTDFVPDDFFCSAGQDEERSSLSQEIGEALQILANAHRYSVIFSNPGMSSTEAKIKHGVENALRELNKAYQAALDLGY